MARALTLVASLVSALVVLTLVQTEARAHSSLTSSPGPSASPTAAASPSPLPSPSPTPSSIPSAAPKAPTFATLLAELESLGSASGSGLAVSLLEYGSLSAGSFALNGDQPWTAASTYKLALLMAEAEGVAGGTLQGSDVLCYQEQDWEDGYFDDYEEGACYTRSELAQRVGHYSDNTAAHILVRYLGGSDVLNGYARVHGAVESAFYVGNTTTSNDLARLWQSELLGQAGGTAAQQWLYPLLTNTRYEAGVPAGVPGGVTVVHKIGQVDSVVNDAALVVNAPHGTYVLVVMTDGTGGSAGWQLVARVSALVWLFEASR
ncbi:MAG TPA: serine hydrolase [Candidatus Acidoferrales bacterium]|nr:serine hydrolase [Candidatus Acidoferrales bacterium]